MSSSTTQKTEIPDATPEERALMEMMTDALMPSYLQETGYDVRKTTGKYEDTKEYKNFKDQRSRTQKEKANYEKQLADLDKKGGGYGNRYGGGGERQTILNNIANANKKLDGIDKEEQKFLKDYKPEESWDVRKMQAPEVEAERRKLVEKYGDLSDEELMKKDRSGKYKKLYQEYEQKDIEKDKSQRKLAETYMEKTQKFLDGDFSIDESQKELIKQNMAPIREAVTKMFDAASAEVDKTGASLTEATKKTFDDFDARVKETGMSMIDGLEATGEQIKATGKSMEDALTNTIGVHRELMKMGIEDYTGQVTKQVAASAAMLGRSPDDPEYTNEMKQLVAKKVQEGSLNLAAMEAQGMVAIKERTGSGMEDIERGKTAVAERTGGALEGSALQRGQQNTAIAERTGGAKEEIARARGAADVGLEETAANLRWQVGAGMAPQQVGLAQGVHQYNEALVQQRIANSASAMYAPMPFVQYMQQERAYEPTVTTKTNPGIGGIFSGIIGAASAGASIYGGISSAGAMNTMANKM